MAKPGQSPSSCQVSVTDGQSGNVGKVDPRGAYAKNASCRRRARVQGKIAGLGQHRGCRHSHWKTPKLSALNPAQRATGICYSSNICCGYFERYIELCFGIALQVV